MSRLDLPGGQWAELRDPKTVTVGKRRPLERAWRRLPVEVIDSIAAANDRVREAKETGDQEAEVLAKRDVLERQRLLSDDDIETLDLVNDLTVVALVDSWSFDQPITLEGIQELPTPAYDALRDKVGPSFAAMFLDTSPDPNPPAPTGGSNGSGTSSTGASPTTSPASGETSASSV